MTIEQMFEQILRRLDNHAAGRFIGTKKIDNLGRITIPISVRRVLNIQDNEQIDIYCGDSEIILKKHLTN